VVPFTCHVTATLLAFVTVAVNGCVLDVTTDALVGEIEIETAGFVEEGGFAVEEELDAQLSNHSAESIVEI
jgi:hypothetical protein